MRGHLAYPGNSSRSPRSRPLGRYWVPIRILRDTLCFIYGVTSFICGVTSFTATTFVYAVTSFMFFSKCYV